MSLDDLLEACGTGDTETVQELVAAGVCSLSRNAPLSARPGSRARVCVAGWALCNGMSDASPFDAERCLCLLVRPVRISGPTRQ